MQEVQRFFAFNKSRIILSSDPREETPWLRRIGKEEGEFRQILQHLFTHDTGLKDPVNPEYFDNRYGIWRSELATTLGADTYGALSRTLLIFHQIYHSVSAHIDADPIYHAVDADRWNDPTTIPIPIPILEGSRTHALLSIIWEPTGIANKVKEVTEVYGGWELQDYLLLRDWDRQPNHQVLSRDREFLGRLVYTRTVYVASNELLESLTFAELTDYELQVKYNFEVNTHKREIYRGSDQQQDLFCVYARIVGADSRPLEPISHH